MRKDPEAEFRLAVGRPRTYDVEAGGYSHSEAETDDGPGDSHIEASNTYKRIMMRAQTNSDLSLYVSSKLTTHCFHVFLSYFLVP